MILLKTPMSECTIIRPTTLLLLPTPVLPTFWKPKLRSRRKTRIAVMKKPKFTILFSLFVPTKPRCIFVLLHCSIYQGHWRQLRVCERFRKLEFYASLGRDVWSKIHQNPKNEKGGCGCLLEFSVLTITLKFQSWWLSSNVIQFRH